MMTCMEKIARGWGGGEEEEEEEVEEEEEEEEDDVSQLECRAVMILCVYPRCI